jgi:hypothetical protein
MYSEAVLREALHEWNGGMIIGCGNINNLRYADDTMLCTKSEPEMSQLIKRVEEASNKYGVIINRNKTKVMIIGRAGVLPHTNVLNGYQKVNEFIYLGSIVQEDGGSSREIRRRVTLRREAVSWLIPIWKDNHISRNSKLRLLKALTFSAMLYGSETYTLKVEDVKQRINPFELWAYRQMLRISWMERRTNFSILAMLLLNIYKRLKATRYRNS